MRNLGSAITTFSITFVFCANMFFFCHKYLSYFIF